MILVDSCMIFDHTRGTDTRLAGLFKTLLIGVCGVVVLACEDNLIRGASGVAVQNFNRMFGFDERMGLE
jgi:N-acetyl-gamma-glutamylphosphate reductase